MSDNKNLQSLRFEAALPHLQHLDVSNSKLERLDIPAGFTALQWLDASRNQLQQVRLEGTLPKLTYLDLSGNQLASFILPAGFRDLAYLYLNDNQLKEVTFSSVLPALQILHLKGNQLEQLPGNLLSLPQLETLYLHGNPLPNIPKEVIANGERDNSWANVRNYLESLAEAGDKVVENDEVKLVLLGNSTAGKSSLIRYLKDKIYDESSLYSTHGIQNLLWEPQEQHYNINIWDFGGQEYFHATHRLFLSRNAVTLIVFEQDTNFQGEQKTEITLYEEGKMVKKAIPIQHFPFSYWLENLEYLCSGQHPNTIVLAQSKMDLPAAEVIPVQEQVRTKYDLREDHIFRISVKGSAAKEDLHALQYQLFEKKLLKILSDTKATYRFNPSWLQIKAQLRDMGKSDPLLSYQDYVSFCESIQPGISRSKPDGSDSMLHTLTDYLHNISAILYYSDVVEDTVFINPQWLTDIIYRVLDYKVIRSEGRFDRTHVAETVSEFDPDKLLALMQEFELIFEVRNQPDHFIAPQYLPAQNQEQDSRSFLRWLHRCDKTAFIIHYPTFLPRSVMTRFICRYGNLALDTFWKHGMVYEMEGCAYFVKSDGNANIQIKTEQLIPHQISEIFADLYEISHKNPEIQITVNGSDFVKISPLLEHSPQNPQIQSVTGKWLNIADFYSIGIGNKGHLENFGASGGTKKTPVKKSIDMNHIQQLIAQARIQKALEALLAAAPAEYKNKVLQLQSRWTELEGKRIRAIISHTEENLERNSITDAALTLYDVITMSENMPLDEQKPAAPERTKPAARTPVAVPNPKVFISYARKEDRRYLELFVAGIKAHSDWQIFDDRLVLIGEDWHERLQKEVQECDFAILLLSPYFFKSDYIKNNEFEHFLTRNIQNGFPFFSVLLADCDYTRWNEIARRQFFVANGQDYDLAKHYRDKQITFDLLARFDRDGELIPNPYLHTFYRNFVTTVNQALQVL